MIKQIMLFFVPVLCMLMPVSVYAMHDGGDGYYLDTQDLIVPCLTVPGVVGDMRELDSLLDDAQRIMLQEGGFQEQELRDVFAARFPTIESWQATDEKDRKTLFLVMLAKRKDTENNQRVTEVRKKVKRIKPFGPTGSYVWWAAGIVAVCFMEIVVTRMMICS